MKKLCFLVLLSIPGIYNAEAQISAPGSSRHVDVSQMEKQAHQRVRDISGNLSIDSFTVASDNIDVNHYRCEWQVDPAVKLITGIVTTSFTVKANSDKIIFDLVTPMGIDSIIYHGNSIQFQRVLKDGLIACHPERGSEGFCQHLLQRCSRPAGNRGILPGDISRQPNHLDTFGTLWCETMVALQKWING